MNSQYEFIEFVPYLFSIHIWLVLESATVISQRRVHTTFYIGSKSDSSSRSQKREERHQMGSGTEGREGTMANAHSATRCERKRSNKIFKYRCGDNRQVLLYFKLILKYLHGEEYKQIQTIHTEICFNYILHIPLSIYCLLSDFGVVICKDVTRCDGD